MVWAIASEILQACNVQIFLTFLMDMHILKKESLKDVQCTEMGLSLQRVRKIVQRCLKCPSVVFGQIFLFPEGFCGHPERRFRGAEVRGVTVFRLKRWRSFPWILNPFTLAMAELHFFLDWHHAMEISVIRRKPCCEEVVLNFQQKTMWAPTALTERWKGGV